jgi:Cu+-exporting ATPase
MDRRNFLRHVTTATAAGSAGLGIAAASASQPKETRSVKWKVNGYTCITCAAGLEVMLKGMQGVTRVAASWPERNVIVGFDEHLISEKTLKDFIQVCGFTLA